MKTSILVGKESPFLEACKTDPRFCFPTAYAVGMIITFVVLMVMKTGQPALLYLVPCTLITVSVVAWSRKEMKKFWKGSSYQVCVCSLRFICCYVPATLCQELSITPECPEFTETLSRKNKNQTKLNKKFISL